VPAGLARRLAGQVAAVRADRAQQQGQQPGWDEHGAVGQEQHRARYFGHYYEVMVDTDKGRIELVLSDYAQIGPLRDWLGSIQQAQILRNPGSPGPGEMGALDVLTIVAGSSGLVAALRVIPEFLRSRRSGLSVTATVKDKKFTISANNAKDVMPILERLINE
jgi:hypothetical protein